MKKLLSIVLATIIIISISACSDSGTGTQETTTYTVSVDITPANSGTISPSADSTFNEGENIDLQANPKEGYIFTGWAGDVTSSDHSLSLTVDKDYNLTANFELKSYELTITTEGEGTVNEKVVQQKSQDYDHGTIVELTANPAQGYRFKEWKGDKTGSENPVEITIDDPKDVMAVFEKKSYPLTVTTDGQGAVSEEVVQPKTTDYEYDSVVKLTASPANGWKFIEWQGDLTGTDTTVQITIDEEKNVTAVFHKETYALNLNTTGQGSIIKDPVQQEYEYGSTVNLTASPAAGWEFMEWQGDATGTDGTVQLTMDDVKDVTAVFKKQSFVLTINTTGQGTVVKNPDQATYEFGTVVDLTANADNGWQFVEWQGDVTGTDSTVQLTLDQAKNITAVFMEQSQNQFYLAQNGVTIKCEDADIGDMGTVNGVTYTKRTTGYSSPITVNNATTSCTSGIINMDELFYYERHFNADISHWDVSSVTSMKAMFKDAWDFNQDISHWDVSSVSNMRSMFENTTAFNIDISSWNVGSVNDMSFMFVDTDSFDVDLGNWDVSSVTNMNGMFQNAKAFNGDLNNWNVSGVTDMSRMFYEAEVFNGDISSWDVSSVTNMQEMFRLATNFNGDLSNWNVSNVEDFTKMFNKAEAFNSDLNNWDISSATTIYAMFRNAKSFNSNLNNWDVSALESMKEVFYSALAFNGDISSWDVSNVKRMDELFLGAKAFNSNISSWNVSNVTNMNSMFQFAESFNQNISVWDVSNVYDMTYMFYQASSFDKDLSSWCVSNISSYPTGFSSGTLLQSSDLPEWGTCPQ